MREEQQSAEEALERPSSVKRPQEREARKWRDDDAIEKRAPRRRVRPRSLDLGELPPSRTRSPPLRND
ncbi:hypothetical protein DSL92_08400 [Billgrantia gudaonensis]|uniref:Uncharacterized protein n=1 Tax=Billgrantia gudaonensis TaxID=376427 RepID=A0A432JGU3_9GAMM|nr:hypothetical protein DSL92_08400 [Halomonas gudaonensis]